MAAGTREGGAARGAVEYFGSFHGYGPELSPVTPIPFEKTQRSASFTEVERDAAGLVAVLRKIGVSRPPGPPVLHALGEPRLPGAELVFDADFDPLVGGHAVGAEVGYPATRSAGAYFAGPVGADGRSAALRLFRRAAIFSEVYDRDSRGRVATAVHFAADKLPRVELFADGVAVPLGDRYAGTRDVGPEARSRAEELRQLAKRRRADEQYQAAIIDLDAALALVEGDSDTGSATVANVLCNLGTGWLDLEDYARATFFAACGLELHARRLSVRGVGVCTLTLAMVFHDRTCYAQAAECYRQAARLFVKAGDPKSQKYALDQLHAIESWQSGDADQG